MSGFLSRARSWLRLREEEHIENDTGHRNQPEPHKKGKVGFFS